MKKKIYIVITLTILAITTVGATYAFFIAFASNNTLASKSSKFSVIYTGGTSLENADIKMLTSKEGATNTTVHIRMDNESIQARANIYIYVDEISEEIATSGFKWAVDGVKSGNTVYTNSGSFNGASDDSKINIVENYKLDYTNTDFTVYLWLDIETVGNEALGKTFNGYIGAETSTFTGEMTTIPNTYQQVEYIKGNGTEYIDTGYAFTSEIGKIEADLKITAIQSQYATLFGSEEYKSPGCTNSSRNFSFILHGGTTNDSSYSAYIGTGSLGNFSITLNNRHIIEYETQSSNKVKINVDYNNVLSSTYSDTIQTHNTTCSEASNKGNIFIFSNHADSSTGATQISNDVEMYGFRIYQDGNMVRNFVPCYRKSDNVVGMYDTITKNFYTNSGSGAFTYGS